MANSDKNIVITPNTGLSGQPQIEFTGAGNSSVSVKVDDGSPAKLNFDSGSKQLFSLDSNQSTSLFSVVDTDNNPIFQTEGDNSVSFNKKTKFESTGYLKLKGNKVPPLAKSGRLIYDQNDKAVKVAGNKGTWIECNDRSIVKEGLVLYFDFTNQNCYPRSGSTVYDLSGTGNNGSITGGFTFMNDGYNDGCFTTDNTGYILVPDNPSLRMAYDKTLSGWFYLGADTSGAGIMGKGESTPKGMNLAYGWSTNGFQNIDWNASNTPALSKAGARDLKKWVYLVGMVYRGVRYIYVFDSFGLRTNTSTGSASWNNGISFSVGGNGVGGNRAPSGSRWKSVHVYDRALTMNEIHRNYQYERLKFNI